VSAFVSASSPPSDVVWPDMSVPQPGVLARDSFQNKRFKLIPSMVEAPWVVQMAVRCVNLKIPVSLRLTDLAVVERTCCRCRSQVQY
jgi:hypothetical protein